MRFRTKYEVDMNSGKQHKETTKLCKRKKKLREIAEI